MLKQKQTSLAKLAMKYTALGALLLATAGCVVDPYPPPPPAAYAPAPGYYAGPYSYYDYPAYTPYYYGPPVSFGFEFGGHDRYHGGYHHWH